MVPVRHDGHRSRRVSPRRTGFLRERRRGVHRLPAGERHGAPPSRLNGTTRDADAGPSPSPSPGHRPASGEAPALHVPGDGLAGPGGTSRGRLVVNRSGGGFPCLRGRGVLDHPVGDASVRAVPDRKANTVRIRTAAARHVRTTHTCSTESCWGPTPAPTAATVLPVAGENTRAHAFTGRAMARSGGRDLSCLGWTWNTWDRSFGPSLISDHDGTPASFGTGPHDHLRALNG